ncbi:MAG: hypothetical protein R3B70_23040 [Polyangiaceae bacterium]
MLLRFLAAAAAAAAIVVLPVGCARGNGEQIDPCERAIDRLVEECGYDVSVDGVELNCTGESACVAVCLEKSPCEDVAAGDGELADCTADCK